ncbi:MAG: rod shape-determining protein [Nitrospinae bacterium]|nr:rod shape-determining protein [Nitrospinota bacterium]
MTAENGASQLLLGIDLGTSRTVVKSNRGEQAVVHSVVGYPKDIIGVKLLGASEIFGEEAVKKRSYLDLYTPLESGVLKEGSDRDIEAARELIKHAVSLAKPRPGDSICGIIGVPARASLANKELLLNIAKQVMDVALVVSEPFMVAYQIGQLKNAIIIDIGAGTTDICGMKGTIPGPGDQVTITKGGDYIDRILAGAISQNFPDVQMTQHLAKVIKEQHAFVGEPKGVKLINLRADGKPVQYDLTAELRMACETIMPDIIENLMNIVAGFDPEDQEEALDNIYVAGGGSRIAGIDQYIRTQMRDYGRVTVRLVDDPEYAGCSGGLKLATELPPAYWDQLGEMIGA